MIKTSERRLAENEAVFRKLNESVYENLSDYTRLAEEAGQNHLVASAPKFPLDFYCECSNTSCSKRTPIELEEYAEIHQQRDYFTVIPGHEVPRIERVVQRKPHYNVVQKHITPSEK